MDRRAFCTSSLATFALAGSLSAREASAPAERGRVITKGRLKQSVSRWCYGGIELDTLCKEAAAMGFHAIDLLDEKDWGVPAKHGLVCALGNGAGGIPRGFNRVEHHDELVNGTLRLLPIAKAAGVPSVIVFSGNRDGLSDEEGVANCITGLKRIAGAAEKEGVQVVIEYLNSKVDHGDYQFDHMKFGVDVVKGVGSPSFKILYDIYHAQIMEGDVIRTIRDNHEWIGHFHTGGVPGRREIDGTQELNYRAIAQAIVDTGYTRYMAHEFVPSRDPLTSLAEAGALCDV
ncbi:MAG: TIM barrel protein [Planctomycetes bacterium]|nr:TIM barrel protein [Planctomycetota bacterium]